MTFDLIFPVRATAGLGVVLAVTVQTTLTVTRVTVSITFTPATNKLVRSTPFQQSG